MSALLTSGVQELYEKCHTAEDEVKRLQEEQEEQEELDELREENATIKAWVCSQDPEVPICP